MLYKIRRSQERGYVDHGWLKTYHTFSFADYYDPHFMGFRSLRVINEDRVAPGEGFPSHDHKNMEIISVVLEGELAHKDSMGNQSVIKAHQVQVMSAGSGVSHSEYNPSKKDFVHFLQIWILPDSKGGPPQYQQTEQLFSPGTVLIASKEGEEKSLKIRQDIKLYALFLKKGEKKSLQLQPARYGWVQLMEGELRFGDDILRVGDAVAMEPNTSIDIEALSSSKFLYIDLN